MSSTFVIVIVEMIGSCRASITCSNDYEVTFRGHGLGYYGTLIVQFMGLRFSRKVASNRGLDGRICCSCSCSQL